MALEGTLEDFSLADIFQLIGIQRKTGILTLKNSHETVSVTFHNGMVVGADSTPKKLEDRIGKVLVKTGLITLEQLKEALDLQKQTLQKIGFILIDQKYITRAELKEALQIQVAQMIYRLFRWSNGEYYFDQKAKVDPDADESIAPMSAESILMEGIQMIDEWPLIQKRIPDFAMVFRSMVQMDEVQTEPESEEDEFDALLSGAIEDKAVPEMEKVRLSREEEAVFRLVDGKNTVADIIESSKLGEFHTCKALYDLLERRIIEQVRTAAPAKESTSVMFRAAQESSPKTMFLVPILGVIVAALVAFSFTDPLRLALFHFFSPDVRDQVQTGLNETRFNLVDSAINLYFRVNGHLPDDLGQLVSENYLRQQDTMDSWSHPFVYQVAGDAYQLTGTVDGKPDDRFSVHRSLKMMEPQNRSKDSTPSIRLQN